MVKYKHKLKNLAALGTETYHSFLNNPTVALLTGIKLYCVR